MVTRVKKRAGLRFLSKTHATEAQRFRAPFVILLFIWLTSSIDQTGVKRTPSYCCQVSTYFVSMVVSPISVDTSNTTFYLSSWIHNPILTGFISSHKSYINLFPSVVSSVYDSSAFELIYYTSSSFTSPPPRPSEDSSNPVELFPSQSSVTLLSSKNPSSRAAAIPESLVLLYLLVESGVGPYPEEHWICIDRISKRFRYVQENIHPIVITSIAENYSTSSPSTITANKERSNTRSFIACIISMLNSVTSTSFTTPTLAEVLLLIHARASPFPAAAFWVITRKLSQ
ncbi:hypothetical protein F5882DRAFT_506403 [Hyaloscypha sp. PMI_1271]|nr:hypothetical protein F5882DRAFT_506403 [Hyaloscypha sp. PMI_1271]